MSERLVSVKELSAGYDGRDIIENVNLEVNRGDFLGVIGPNGGGKTTLIKVIAGVLKPHSGEVLVFGKNPVKFTAADRIRMGYVRQEANIDTSFPVSVADTVMMGLYPAIPMLKPSGKAEKEKVLKALSLTQMEEFADAHIGSLSGGQKQRVFISRAIVHGPELLVLDEPTTGVDSKNQGSFYQMLVTLKKEMNLTVIMVSHEVNDLAKQANMISCVNKSMHVHGSSEGILSDDVVCEACGLDTHRIKLRGLHHHE